MRQAKIIETNLPHGDLSERSQTTAIVIHHTGEADIDASAEQINQWHRNQNWSMCGYHFVIRKNGDIERGRPEWAVGSHAYQHNFYTIGIHISGDFMQAYPTSEQIESAALLIANLCIKYNIPIDRDHIVGHRDLMPTSCPGDNLYNQLDIVIGKANWYAYADTSESQEAIQEESQTEDFDINVVAQLARKYESSGDPGAVSSGRGDIGGISYGLYQFASNVGVVDTFVDWLRSYPDDALANYGRVLAKHKVNSEGFINQWKELGRLDPGNFGRLQDEYIKKQYYDTAAQRLKKENFDIEKHTNALRSVLLSRSIQNGPGGCVKLFKIACERLGHPNLSYIDDSYFDKDIISAIYDFLIEECDSAVMKNDGYYHSTYDFCHGGKNVINGLRNRFVHEKEDALNLL